MKAWIVLSDGHSGHDEGLLNPDSLDANDNPLYLSAVQESIWDTVIQAKDFLDTNYKRADKWLIHLAELVQGNMHKDSLLTAKMWLQFQWAKDTLRPILGMKGMKGARFLQGTSWHEYSDGSGSKTITDSLAKEFPKLNFKSMNQSRILADDLLFAWTHHGKSSSKLPFHEGNAARNTAKNNYWEALSYGERCPDISFSAHTHKPDKGTYDKLTKDGEFFTTTHVITAPLCGPGAYSRKVANPSSYWVGCNVVLSDDIGIKVVPFYKRLYDYHLEEI